MEYTLTAIDAYFMYTVLLKMYFMYVKCQLQYVHEVHFNST